MPEVFCTPFGRLSSVQTSSWADNACPKPADDCICEAVRAVRSAPMRSFDLGRKPDAEDLPVTFDLHSDLGKPLLDILQQLPQLSLVGTEDREVVHLPMISL